MIGEKRMRILTFTHDKVCAAVTKLIHLRTAAYIAAINVVFQFIIVH